MIFHKHIWEDVKKEAITEPVWYGANAWKYQPRTIVTQQCNKCKKYRQQELKGTIGSNE